MDKKTKQKNLDFLVDRLKNWESVVFTNFKGLNAQEMSSIKKLARDEKGEYKVVKNTIVLKAIDKSGRQGAEQLVSGSCALAFLPEDPMSLLKELVGFSKAHQALVLKGGIIDGEVLSDESLKELAALPSKTELLTNIVSGLNAPINKLVSCLHQMIFSLVSVIDSIKTKNSSDDSRNIQDGGKKDV
jgi:large subunit ribosomal protein L10